MRSLTGLGEQAWTDPATEEGLKLMERAGGTGAQGVDVFGQEAREGREVRCHKGTARALSY
jgi:hypothetical protein